MKSMVPMQFLLLVLEGITDSSVAEPHHGREAVVGHRDAYWASGRSAVTNSLLLSVLWTVGMFGADRNFQHWAEPRRSVGVGNLV